MTQFGCPLCYGEDAETVSTNHSSFPGTDSIVNESHFVVAIRECTGCGQRFLRIFTEFVDWEGGDDPQYVDILPITEEELAEIVRQGEGVDLRYLGGLGAGRRRLRMDWPSGGRRLVGWGTGAFTVHEGE
ncbi:hypothetical protein GCM10029964_094860 [Kibdelosporangium lantanae]